MLCPRMAKNVNDVRTYIAKSPAERQPALKRLRSLCNEVLKGYDEGMDYGMPVYKRNGTAEVAFASQKQYISLYVLKTDVVNAHREALRGCSVGKGCIRFRRPQQINFGVVKKLLLGTVESASQPCAD